MMTLLRRHLTRALHWCDSRLRSAACLERRLIGMSLLRIALGASAVIFYVSDYQRRQFFWGPDSYMSPGIAAARCPNAACSLFLVDDSQLWFELVFHLGFLVAILFTIFGGRILALCHAVLLWSIYDRNQDILQGGDNLARIVILFMVFTVSNAYFAPGAPQRRSRLRAAEQEPSLSTLLHNAAALLVVFQIANVYFWAGVWKVTGPLWLHGTAMYYISRVTMFSMSGTYAHVMANPLIGTVVAYFTVTAEVAFPVAVLSSRAWVRKAETLALEGMHFGIIVCMGLVCFGLTMIGADCTVLKDGDYLRVWGHIRRLIAVRRSKPGAEVAQPSRDRTPSATR